MSRGPISRQCCSSWLRGAWLWGMLAGCGSGSVHVKPSDATLESGSWHEGAAEPERWKPGTIYAIDPQPGGTLGGSVRAAAVSGDGRVLALATDVGVDFFDGQSLEWLGSIPAAKSSSEPRPRRNTQRETSIWLSPDGHYLARVDEAGLNAWDLATGARQMAPFSRNVEPIPGDVEVIGSNPNQFFLRRAGEVPQVEAAASLSRSAVTVSPDTRFAISVADEASWLLIDRNDGSALALGEQTSGAAAFSPASRYLALAASTPKPALQLWRLPELSLERQLPISDVELDLPPIFNRSETQVALVNRATRRMRLCELAANSCTDAALPDSRDPIVSVLPHGQHGFMSVSATGELVLIPELRSTQLRPARQRIEPWPGGQLYVRASPSLDRVVVSSGQTRLGVPIESSADRHVQDLTRLIEQESASSELRAYAELVLPYSENIPTGSVVHYWTQDGARSRVVNRPIGPGLRLRNAGEFALHWPGPAPPDCQGPLSVTPLSLGVAELPEYDLAARPYPLALVPGGRGLLAVTCEGLTHFAMNESTLSSPRLLAAGVIPDRLEVPAPGTHAIVFVQGKPDNRLVIYPIASPSHPTLDLHEPYLTYVLSDDGRYLATLTPRELRIWDWAVAREIHAWPRPPSLLYLRSVMRDGQGAVAMPDGVHVWVFGPGDALVRHPPLASHPYALSENGSIALLVEGSKIQLQRARDSQVVRLIMLRLGPAEVVIAAETPDGLYSGFPAPRRLRRGGIFGGQRIPDAISRRCFERSDLVGALFRDEPIEKPGPECAELSP